MIAFDLLTDNSGDLLIDHGDFSVGESDGQHIEDILLGFPGDYKQYPLIGVNLASYLSAPNSPEVINRLRRSIQLQLESDNYRVDYLDMSKGIMDSQIKAERVK